MARSRENLSKEAKQKFKELRFTDDFMFCRILEKNPNLTKGILEIILGFKIKDIHVQQQKTMEITDEAKGIRADIYAQDEDRDAYDLEMQKVSRRELPKRARYYQSVIDLKMIDRGSNYSDLRKSYVIFLCLTDPFDQGQYIYTIKNSCVECNEMNYEDETCKIFINASGTKGEISDDLKAFIALLRGEYVKHPLIDAIIKAVEEAQRDEEWRSEFVTEYIFLQDIRDDAREEGLEEGRKEGREEGRKEGLEEGRKEGREQGCEEGKMTISREVVMYMTSNGKSPEEIATLTGLSQDLILRILTEQ